MNRLKPADFTSLIDRARAGDETARDSFWRLVYGELRSLADRELAGERSGHTLQPTALVNEAYLRLAGKGPLLWESRAHFFGAAARAMRQVLVDHARARGRKKRAGAPLDVSGVGVDGLDLDLLSLDEALDRLEALDPRKARVVALRFFAGLSVREVARLLGVAAGTVSGDWKIAKMWLLRELSGEEARGS